MTRDAMIGTGRPARAVRAATTEVGDARRRVEQLLVALPGR